MLAQEVRPPFDCKEHLGIPLKSLQGNRASSVDEMGNKEFLCGCDRDLAGLSNVNRFPGLVSHLKHGTPLSS